MDILITSLTREERTGLENLSFSLGSANYYIATTHQRRSQGEKGVSDFSLFWFGFSLLTFYRFLKLDFGSSKLLCMKTCSCLRDFAPGVSDGFERALQRGRAGKENSGC